jgi:hypothetical protein
VRRNTGQDLAGYRGAVADLLLEIASHTGPENLPKAERVLTERLADAARADAMILMDVSMDDGRIPMLRDVGVDAVLIGLPADPGGLGCVDRALPA